MWYTPDSHLSKRIDQLKGRWFGRYRPICDPTLRGCRHRVLMVTAITISSLRTVTRELLAICRRFSALLESKSDVQKLLYGLQNFVNDGEPE